MTQDVYIGANLAKKEKESWYCSDKVNYVLSGIFAQNGPFSLQKKKKRNARVLLRRPMIYCECGEHIWKTFLPAFRRA